MSHRHFCDVAGHLWECDGAARLGDTEPSVCMCHGCRLPLEQGDHSRCKNLVELVACPEHREEELRRREEAEKEFERRAAEFGFDEKWATDEGAAGRAGEARPRRGNREVAVRDEATGSGSVIVAGRGDGGREPKRRGTLGGVPKAADRLGAGRAAQMGRAREGPPRLRHMPVVPGTVPHVAGLGSLRQPGVRACRAAHDWEQGCWQHEPEKGNGDEETLRARCDFMRGFESVPA